MKKIIVILTLMTSTFCIYAQNVKVETAIRKLEEAEHNAMLVRDTITLQKIWASDFTVNTPANRITHSRKELFGLINAGVFNYTSFTRDIEHIFIKGDVVITMGREAVVPVNSKLEPGTTVNRRYTNIWMKQNGVWRLTARHANELCQ